MASGLIDDAARAWIGRSQPPVTVEVSRRDIQKYAVATEQRRRAYIDGDEAPPMFLFGLLRPVVPLDKLQPDGIAADAFLPDLPLKRIMAGGIKMTYHRPIKAGDVLTATRHADGHAGEAGLDRAPDLYLLFDEGGRRRRRARRRGDVYKDRAMSRIDDIKVGDALPERAYTATEVSLFLYNAAIWNGHRIHYDAPYTTNVEKHPAIVIDGPLQGDWLSQCVLDWLGEDGALLSFGYSNRRAAYIGETLTAVGEVVGKDAAAGTVDVKLGIRNEKGDIIAPGEATVRFD